MVTDALEKPSVVTYLGPDTLLPLGSALAGLVGVGLLFGQRLASLARKTARKLKGQPPEERQDEPDEEPDSKPSSD